MGEYNGSPFDPEDDWETHEDVYTKWNSHKDEAEKDYQSGWRAFALRYAGGPLLRPLNVR